MRDLHDLSYDTLLQLSMSVENKLKGIDAEKKQDEIELLLSHLVADTDNRHELLAFFDQVNAMIIAKNEENAKTIQIEDKDDEIGTYRVLHVAKGYVFCLVGKDGQVLAESNIYSTKEGCEKGISSFQKNAESPIDTSLVQETKQTSNPKFQIFKNESGYYAFRLRAANGEILTVSHSFGTIDECENRVRKIARLAKTQLIEKG